PPHYPLSLHDALPISTNLTMTVTHITGHRARAFLRPGSMTVTAGYRAIDVNFFFHPKSCLFKSRKEFRLQVIPCLSATSAASALDRKSTRLNSSHVNI